MQLDEVEPRPHRLQHASPTRCTRTRWARCTAASSRRSSTPRWVARCRRTLPADAGFTTLELKTNFVRADHARRPDACYAEGSRRALRRPRRDDRSARARRRRHALRARDVDVPDPARRRDERDADTIVDDARRRHASLTVREITLDDVDRLAPHVHPAVARQRVPPVLLPHPRAAPRRAAVAGRRRPRPAGTPSWPSTATRSWPWPATTAGPAPITAEIAVTVEDAWQHQGVGKRLTKRLAVRAVDHGHRVVRGRRAARQPGRARTRRASSRPTRRCTSTAASTRRRCRSHARAERRGSRVTAARLAVARRAVGEAVRRTARPDHVSSTAHTLLSTRPCASPTSRTMLSRRSVATPAVRFGHAIHNPPAEPIARAKRVEATLELREPRREEQHDVVLRRALA